MQPPIRKLQLTPIHRVAVLLLIITQYILFVWSNVLLVNYHSFKIPFVEYQSMTTTVSTETHYLKNSCLYLFFWLQHIIMATLKYKTNWYSRFQYFVLYDRYLFNISSGLALWICFSYVQPSNIHLFTLPLWICLPISIFGVVILWISIRQLGGRVMMPYKISSIMNEKSLAYECYNEKKNDQLKTDGIYGYLRHPMQAGVLLLIVFGNNVYTTQRLLFTMLMGGGVVIGVYMEQKRMIAQFANYKAYMEKVTSRFLPSLF